MSWLNKNKVLDSEEYDKLHKKIVAMVSDIDVITNKLTLLTQIVNSNRARINKIKIEEIEDAPEKDLKDAPTYI